MSENMEDSMYNSAVRKFDEFMEDASMWHVDFTPIGNPGPFRARRQPDKERLSVHEMGTDRRVGYFEKRESNGDERVWFIPEEGAQSANKGLMNQKRVVNKLLIGDEAT